MKRQYWDPEIEYLFLPEEDVVRTSLLGSTTGGVITSYNYGDIFM